MKDDSGTAQGRRFREVSEKSPCRWQTLFASALELLEPHLPSTGQKHDKPRPPSYEKDRSHPARMGVVANPRVISRLAAVAILGCGSFGRHKTEPKWSVDAGRRSDASRKSEDVRARGSG